jgi:mannose-1-phosphate guanylyltransferase
MTELPLAALVLAGGYGTRLRPLTLGHSKPLVEFCNRPNIEYLLDALTSVGVVKIVLALSELQPDLRRYISEYQTAHPGVAIVPSVEPVPLGTAGPIALAKEHLAGHRFFMLNSDVISRFPLAELLEFHVRKGGEGTIMSWDVQDPSRFGVILSDENQRITSFVEKPTMFVGRSINSGHYIFEPEIIERVRPVLTSIEREIFPQMASEGKLFVVPLEGLWMDIGTPEGVLDCIPLFLEGEKKVLIDESAEIGPDCQIGPNVVIGPNVKIGAACCIQNAVVMAGSRVGNGALIMDSIIGWNARIGKWARILSKSCFGEDVTVGDRLVVQETIVLPHKAVTQNYMERTIIL